MVAGWRVEIIGENAQESPYIYMTREMCSYFHWSKKHSPHPEYGMKDGIYPVDPDASNGSYFWAAGWIAGHPASNDPHPVTVAHWPVLGAGSKSTRIFQTTGFFQKQSPEKPTLATAS